MTEIIPGTNTPTSKTDRSSFERLSRVEAENASLRAQLAAPEAKNMATHSDWTQDFAEQVRLREAAEAQLASARKALKEIITADQLEQLSTIKMDAAGNDYIVEMVDGHCARIARKALKPDGDNNG